MYEDERDIDIWLVGRLTAGQLPQRSGLTTRDRFVREALGQPAGRAGTAAVTAVWEESLRAPRAHRAAGLGARRPDGREPARHGRTAETV
ncbi:predicted protein [Streptomyces viridochromogenes DSM 40736]|uniref:Predicted protein n=1 Tax=Streptomyces viridochromogenes (strain DSM 40736 / JCM 4977 / BCRC 1201 / Tue 494) TaxID=591159 RepID=D9X682_STRVT|nr:predicted protein [Streptomyces viridochromogenes DSM 40736]